VAEDPAIQDLSRRLERAKLNLKTSERLSRDSSDPAILRSRQAIAALVAELAALGKQISGERLQKAPPTTSITEVEKDSRDHKLTELKSGVDQLQSVVDLHRRGYVALSELERELDQLRALVDQYAQSSHQAPAEALAAKIAELKAAVAAREKPLAARPGAAYSIVTAPAGRVIVGVAPHAATSVSRVVTLPARVVLRGPLGRRLWSLAFSPDGKSLATGAGVRRPDNSGFNDPAGELAVWDAGEGKLHCSTGTEKIVRTVAFSPDGSIIASAGFEPVVHLRNALCGKEIRSLTAAEAGVNSLAFSPDGRTLAAAGLDGKVRLWEVASGRVVAVLDCGTAPVYSVVFAVDGSSVVCGGEDRTVRVWDLDSGKLRMSMLGHGDVVEAVAVAPEGKRIASASWDRSVKIWDAATGKEVATLKGHLHPVLGLAFSPDGKTLATASAPWGSSNETSPGASDLRLWDVASWTSGHVFACHPDRVFGLAFSPDGKTIATAGWDSTVKLWDVEALRSARWEPPALMRPPAPGSGLYPPGTLPQPVLPPVPPLAPGPPRSATPAAERPANETPEVVPRQPENAPANAESAQEPAVRPTPEVPPAIPAAPVPEAPAEDVPARRS
jgi:WD40 repeat protein